MRSVQTAKEFAIRQGLKGIFRLLPHISDERLLKFAESRIDTIPYPEGRDFVEQLILQAKRALTESSPACRKRGIENFFLNSLLTGYERREQFQKENGFYPSYFFVISPTMRCNLGCYGCYAGEYSKGEELDEATVDRVLTEAEDCGIFFITVSGGEPFCYEPLFRLAEKHDQIYFQIYTNGTLIDDALARRISEIGNMLPVISVEGFEEETDTRRGKGTFRRICEAMDRLREHRAIFGFSCTVTRGNNELVVSDEFLDFYAKKGCFIGWYFNYVPIGRKPDFDLMPTPEQRLRRRSRLNAVRSKYPMVLADFWNDGPLVGGCIAGGSSYFHINCRGDAEPCVFVHFATHNVKTSSLREIMNSPFFRAIRSRQPYCRNLLRPCMIIDNPWVMRKIVAETGAKPTHPGADEILKSLADRMDRYACRYAEIADPVWEREYAEEASAGGEETVPETPVQARQHTPA